MKKAVAYCRYSTDNQTENSIEYQLSAIEKYCILHQLELVDVYSDEAQTGINTNRAGLQRLLKDAQAHKFNAVVIYDQTRMSRNVVDWFTLRETLQNNRIDIYGVHSQIGGDINTPTVFLNESVSAIFGQMHVLQTREKTIDGVLEKAKKAEFCGGIPALGYDVKDGHYIINAKEAETVRLIFQMYANGSSYGDIVDILTQKGCTTKRGGKFGKNALYWILRNERYAGYYVFNKQQYKVLGKRNFVRCNPEEKIVRIKGAVPAIVDMHTWNIVQKRLSNHKHNASNTAKREYLLSGLIECGKCGESYYGFTSKNKGGRETSYYACSRKARKRDCSAKNIKAEELEPAVYYIVKQKFLNPQFIQATAEVMASQWEKCRDISKDLKKQLDKTDNSIQNLLRAVENGLSSESTYERINQLQEQKNRIKARMQTLSERGGQIDKNQLIQKLTKDAKDFSNDSTKRKAILKGYIDKIKITDKEVILLFTGDLTNSAYSSTTGGATPPTSVLEYKISISELQEYGYAI